LTGGFMFLIESALCAESAIVVGIVVGLLESAFIFAIESAIFIESAILVESAIVVGVPAKFESALFAFFSPHPTTASRAAAIRNFRIASPFR
jgi:hypothetical protein